MPQTARKNEPVIGATLAELEGEINGALPKGPKELVSWCVAYAKAARDRADARKSDGARMLAACRASRAWTADLGRDIGRIRRELDPQTSTSPALTLGGTPLDVLRALIPAADLTVAMATLSSAEQLCVAMATPKDHRPPNQDDKEMLFNLRLRFIAWGVPIRAKTGGASKELVSVFVSIKSYRDRQDASIDAVIKYIARQPGLPSILQTKPRRS